MEGLLKNIDFNGAVYHKKNRQKYEYYLGYQDIAEQRYISESTQFNLASLSKMYTAVMVFQLIEQGRPQLSDKITNWLNATHFTEVTVAQLLTHTSGIPEYLVEV
ncbi:serine hydrolase domain-containing protein [Paenibacillus aceti]|uniref:Beta-lactamase-related domain-containing protein n=1 Tax=Paenibacillus aceti TaxID=1820010 RepID=A0ABQ1W8S5_9BACL|nr:serine hydrolase domain-containing protein [Paenibacillus aceti]GGG17684.1 hypothetical protein GCM10010913_44740 [Paenibacillus aceti]